MVLTVRQRGQLLLQDGEVIDDAVATVWFEGDEERGAWGGIIEPQLAGTLICAQVSVGQTTYVLRLEDGREGTVSLSLSEFDADGAHPLTFTGAGALARRQGAKHG
jgi:hypothetical protein